MSVFCWEVMGGGQRSPQLPLRAGSLWRVPSQNPGTKSQEDFQVAVAWEGCQKLGEGAQKAVKR